MDPFGTGPDSVLKRYLIYRESGCRDTSNKKYSWYIAEPIHNGYTPVLLMQNSENWNIM